MRTKIILLAFLLVFAAGNKCAAQKVSVSTNLVDWAYLWTVNGELGFSVDQHFSVVAGGKVNPWNFEKPNGKDIYNCQSTVYAGARYWPWYVFSGWWMGAKVQYSSFSNTGLFRPELTEGKSVGAGLSAGYTFMINERLNLELGAGFWGGRHFKYNQYDSPEALNLISTAPKNFIAVDNVTIAFMYIF